MFPVWQYPSQVISGTTRKCPISNQQTETNKVDKKLREYSNVFALHSYYIATGSLEKILQDLVSLVGLTATNQ